MSGNRRRHQQSTGPPWKGMNLASSSAALRVLIVAALCQGLQSQNLAYHLAVRASVPVPHGLCVHIPCNFTYDQRDRTDPGKLYGYWFLNKAGYSHSFAHNSRNSPGYLVATNDQRQSLSSYVKNRFQLTGEPEEGNCSFSILNIDGWYAGQYYFRIEDKDLRYTYPTPTPQVLVTELEKPEIWASSAVLSGKEAVYTCVVSWPCNKNYPTISWETPLKGYETPQWSQWHSYGNWTYGSNFTFTPYLQDQGKRLTCRAQYTHVWKETENTISLDIFDPPKTVEISTNATDHRHLALCAPEGKGGLDSAVVREGESISLHCSARGRPDPTLSWRKGNETLGSTRQGMERVLLLSEVGPEDAGEYQCRAETPHGSASKTLRLCVLYGPKLSSNRSRSTCWQEDHSLHCNCSLSSWPPPQFQWEVDGQTFSENSHGGPLPITSGPQENTVISNLSWTAGNLDESHTIICRGANPMGIYTMHFLFSPAAKGSLSGLAIAGLCGALVAVILGVLCLALIKFCKQRKGKASSKAGGVEVLNSANGGHQRANDDGSLVHSNIPPSGKKAPREKMFSSSLQVPHSSVSEPEELYYANLEFSKLKAKEPTPPEEFVEYTEVKQI